MKQKGFNKPSFSTAGEAFSGKNYSTSSIISKLIVTQVAMVIFGSVVQMSVHNISDVLFLAAGIFSSIFYWVLLYNTIWEIGMSDNIKVVGGRLDSNPFRIIKPILIANALNIILALVSTIAFLFNGCSITFESNSVLESIFGMSDTIFKFIHVEYAGILYHFNLHTNQFIKLAEILPAIIAPFIGYAIGLKGRTLRSYIGIKTKYDNLTKK